MLYVIYNDTTKAVYTASEKDDTVVPTGHTKVEIAGGFAGQSLTSNITNYDYIDSALEINQDRIDAQVTEEEQVATDKASANTKLLDLGLTQDEIDALKG